MGTDDLESVVAELPAESVELPHALRRGSVGEKRDMDGLGLEPRARKRVALDDLADLGPVPHDDRHGQTQVLGHPSLDVPATAAPEPGPVKTTFPLWR